MVAGRSSAGTVWQKFSQTAKGGSLPNSHSPGQRVRVIQDRIGWQKIDLSINDGQDDVLAQVVAETGVRL